ncbi:MAG: acyl-CoA synthetase, partial [Thermodesulfobacteriota bacterium]
MIPEEEIPLLARAAGHLDRTALADPAGEYTYGRLLEASARVAAALLGREHDLAGSRVAFLVEPSFGWTTVLWGVWRAGGIAVPLALSHPRPELEYAIDDAQASILLASPPLVERLRPLTAGWGTRLVRLDQALGSEKTTLPQVAPDRRAMIIYTSGTTGRPKGVVTTHRQIQAQITTLIRAWAWTSEDRILGVLPLHHVHGIVNVLLCALWAGAVCEIWPKFEAEAVWRRFVQGGLTLFMAVPTIYARLIEAFAGFPPDLREQAARSAARLRLMVSGSAALPPRILEEWRRITGHVLLERYGMTEIGMALSNPLEGERVPGSVGCPLPGVAVRLADENGPTAGPGEIQVKGPGVFLEYWRRPEETAACFTRDGWFRTGDAAVREGDRYRILGRQSVDIIKTGGEKVSALEIEAALLEHPRIKECAVVGLPDPEWGQRVAAAVVLKDEGGLDLDNLRAWAKERLAPYKVPARLLVLAALP